MLKILIGKNEKILNENEFNSICNNFENICVDIGTGDGKNIYKQALKDPNTLFIGIDTVKENMLKTSSKIIKKYRNIPCNILFIVSTVENMPSFVESIANKITVYFPWGVLLEAIIKPIESFLEKIVHIARNGANFDFITTYCENYEGDEIKNRELPKIDLKYFGKEYSKILKLTGLILENIHEMTNDELKIFNSKWAKKLAFGRARRFFRLNGTVSKL